MSKHNSSLKKEQYDLFNSEKGVQQIQKESSKVIAPIYYLSDNREQEEKKREKEALDIARSLSRHLSIWE